MLSEKREYVLWDSYTGEDIATLDTRSDANTEQSIYERNGEYQTRIRTVVTKD